MVVFVCNSCGETLRKNRVDKHLSQCRSKSISCVDCNKDFTDDYYLHNQCVSEDQKYGGLEFKPKEISTKGKVKQEEWIQRVKTTINGSNCSKHIKDLMQRLVGFDNIPRKRPKFINFVRNSLHITNDYYGQQMWDIFEQSIKGDPNMSPIETNTNENEAKSGQKRQLNGSDINGSVESKKLKENDDKPEDNSNESVEPLETETNGNNESQSEELDENDSQLVSKPKIKIIDLIKDILIKCENNELNAKKLKKKVLKKYKSIDENYCKEKVVSKFEKTLKKSKKLLTNEGLVSLKPQNNEIIE